MKTDLPPATTSPHRLWPKAPAINQIINRAHSGAQNDKKND
jgi:hypothetical protein